MKKLLIIQTSLNKESKTAIVAKKAENIANNTPWIEVKYLDLREYDLQMCNWSKIEDYNADMNKIKDMVEEVDMYILAYPIYNYSFSWVCKNFIDVYSNFMNGKKLSIIQNSYSVRSFSDWFAELSKILSLHDNIEIVLPMVHSYFEDFDWNEVKNSKIIEKLTESIVNLKNA
jgi:NAD(P)H-dependent FMN reductase